MTDNVLTTIPIEWNEELEQYFKSTGEKAQGLAWLHKQSESMYSYRTTFLDLPTIIIGAVNGFLSVGSKQIFVNDDYASVYIGIVALFVSILNTINSYFSWSRRAENHRISSLQYSKLHHSLYIQMTLPRKERINPTELLKQVNQAYDRLREISPVVPDTIVQKFNSKFSNVKLTLPEDVNTLQGISIHHFHENNEVIYDKN
jgi:hypothetical protein